MSPLNTGVLLAHHVLHWKPPAGGVRGTAGEVFSIHAPVVSYVPSSSESFPCGEAAVAVEDAAVFLQSDKQRGGRPAGSAEEVVEAQEASS